jgi:drug/metabolite transporter (DMT)-like permease
MALVLGLAGSALTIGPAADAKPLGIFLGIGAALIYAIYITIGSRVLTRVSPLQMAALVSVSASAVFGAVMLVSGATFPGNAAGWLATIAIALISTVTAILAFFAGLERVGPVNASTLSTAEPIVTLVLAWLFLGEGITLLRLTGGAMILLAVILLARQGMKDADAMPALAAGGPRDRS